MKIISVKPGTPIKWYLTAVSVLLLLFTVFAPQIAFSFAAVNFVFFVVRGIVKKEKVTRRFLWYMLFGIVLCNVAAFLYVSLVKTGLASTCDDFRKTIDTGIFMKNNIPAFLKALLVSVRTDGSIPFPAIFIAPLLTLFGGSFPVYILLLFNLFFVPFLIVMELVVCKISPKSAPLAFFFAPFLHPVLQGNLSVAGLLFAAIWVYVIFKQTFRKRTAQKAVHLGVVSFFLVLVSRWHLFFVLAAIFSAVISICIRRLFDKNYQVKERFINLGISAAVFFCLTCFILPGSVKDAVFSLAKWDGNVIFHNVQMIFGYIGIGQLLFALLGVLGLWRRHFRQFTLFLLSLSALLLFQPAIGSGAQAYLFAPQLFLSAVVGVSALPKGKKTALAVLYVVTCISFLCGFLK